jgi:3-hydroxyacyl-CoA dehydrogenase
MLHISDSAGSRLLKLDSPPVNGLSLPLRRALMEALDAADTDPAVLAVVLTGSAVGFSGGADIREFGQPDMLATPNLHDLCERLDAMSKPVVAALTGMALGGGLELAMCCHYRVAATDCMLGLPEVNIGLLPGAGGTQRLPRALGIETALAMIVDGQPRSAQVLAGVLNQRLIDALCPAPSLLEAANKLALSKVAQLANGQAPKLTRLRDQSPLDSGGSVENATPTESLLNAARKHAAALPYPAPSACVTAVGACAELPFEQGLALERTLFESLLATPACAALRHAFFAEREAAKVPGVQPDTPRRTIKRVGVLGAGTMGSGIATACLMAGFAVDLVDPEEAALARGIAAIEQHLASQAKKGKLDGAAAARLRTQLAGYTQDTALAEADLIIEAVFEDMALKQEVFRRLDLVAKPGAILATNTSTLDVDAIAAVTQRPADVLGLHFFSPAAVMKLLEIVRGKATSATTLASCLTFGKRIRKVCVVSGVCDGFIGNRMLDKYLEQALFLLDEGCSPEEVDRAIEAWGFAMGPFRMSDLAGNDVGWRVRQQRVKLGKKQRPQPLADRLCEVGRLGQKAGGGWYDYRGREAYPAPAVATMLADHRSRLGQATRTVSDDEVVHRLLLALAVEGEALLAEGIALRASDIDLVYLSGYGFPRWRGGPMHAAQALGPKRARWHAQFASHPHDDAKFWSV